MSDGLLQIASTASTVFVGSALLAAGLLKAADFRGAWVGVLDYQLVTARLARPVAALQIVVEVTLGLALIVGLPLALSLGVCLLSAFSLAAASALIRGLAIDCHCGGAGERLGLHTLGRNALLVLMLLLALMVRRDLPALELRHFDGELAGALSAGMLTAIGMVATSASRIWVSRKDFVHITRRRTN